MGLGDTEHLRMVVSEYLVVLEKDIAFLDSKIEVQDLEEFAFDPTYILIAKVSSAYRPMNIPQRGIVAVFMSNNQGTKKDMLVLTLRMGEP